MDEAARAKASEISDEMAPHSLGHCFLVHGSGMFSALARTIIAGMQLFTKSKSEWKVVASREAAVEWCGAVLRRHGLPVDDARLLEAIVLAEQAPASSSR
jgi:hypothetical protein